VGQTFGQGWAPAAHGDHINQGDFHQGKGSTVGLSPTVADIYATSSRGGDGTEQRRRNWTKLNLEDGLGYGGN
jgi:hypothetical protein